MNFQFYFEKLSKSKDFEKFKSENKDAFLCSGFFIIDKKGNDSKQNLDYFVPSLNKMFTFKLELDKDIELVPVENFGETNKIEKIPEDLDFDFNEIERIIEGEMFDKKINNKIEKILLSLQSNDKKNYILGTVFISGLGLIKIKIDLNTKEVVDFEKKSFFDMVKIVRK